MIEIWRKSTGFYTRLADSARMILKKRWFSYPQILEICGQENREEYAPAEHPPPIEIQNT